MFVCGCVSGYVGVVCVWEGVCVCVCVCVCVVGGVGVVVPGFVCGVCGFEEGVFVWV